jgi:hypothetical protein
MHSIGEFHSRCMLDPNTDTTTEDFRQDLEIKVTKVSMGALTKK